MLALWYPGNVGAVVPYYTRVTLNTERDRTERNGTPNGTEGDGTERDASYDDSVVISVLYFQFKIYLK